MVEALFGQAVRSELYGFFASWLLVALGCSSTSEGNLVVAGTFHDLVDIEVWG